jgi:SpoIID/LytB domain protein
MSTFVRWPAALLVGLLLFSSAQLPAAASGDPTGSVTITGGGWGHGIGLSQYGARAQAEAGRSAEEILSYYYSGSMLGQTGVGNVTGHPDPLWIGLVQNRTTVGFRNDPASTGSLSIRRGSDRGLVGSLAAGQSAEVTRSATGCTVRLHTTTTQLSDCALDVDWSYAAGTPTTIVHAPSPHNTGEMALRRGSLRVRPSSTSSTGLHASVRIPLEEYLYGIQEIPNNWHTEVLRAQAVAARTYAVERSRGRSTADGLPTSARQAECWCHLRATSADQYYTGWAGENAAWRAAVASTSRSVVTHPHSNGRAIPTFYASSTGGRTENNEDIWGGSPLPYLRSVDDHWSSDPRAANPHANWTVNLDYGEVTQKLGFDHIEDMSVPSRFVSGTPTSIEVSGAVGGQVVVRSYTAPQFRTLFGLRSQHIRSIALDRPVDVEWLEGDFTGDGKTDLALLDVSSGTWRVARSTGSAFVLEFWNRTPGGSGWENLVADVDGDGRDDIVSYHEPTGEWWVSRSTGATFVREQWGRFSTRTGWQTHLVGDFTGDGRQDTVSYHVGSGTWWVNESTGTSFRLRRWNQYSTTSGWQEHLVADVDGDGKDDVVSFHSAGTWWVGRSTGTSFRSELWSRYSTTAGWVTHQSGDVTGDGRDDVVSYHEPSGRWWVARSTGSAFRPELWGTFSTRTGWQAHRLADFTGDGRQDLVSYHPGAGTWWVSRSTGAAFGVELWHRFPTRTGWDPLLVGDFTGSGYDDVFIYHGETAGLWVNRSSGTRFNSSLWLRAR